MSDRHNHNMFVSNWSTCVMMHGFVFSRLKYDRTRSSVLMFLLSRAKRTNYLVWLYHGVVLLYGQDVFIL